MTEEQQESILDYIDELAPRMRLQGWEFVWNQDPDPEDGSAVAEVNCTHGRRQASVWTSDRFWDSRAEDQRHILVHELVHCVIWPMWEMVVDDLDEHLGAQAHRLFTDAYSRAMEYSVDDLAAAIAPSMPLPPWDDDFDAEAMIANLARLG